MIRIAIACCDPINFACPSTTVNSYARSILLHWVVQITVYIGKRDFIDYQTRTDPIGLSVLITNSSSHAIFEYFFGRWSSFPYVASINKTQWCTTDVRFPNFLLRTWMHSMFFPHSTTPLYEILFAATDAASNTLTKNKKFLYSKWNLCTRASLHVHTDVIILR
jgi:hypothetical protein